MGELIELPDPVLFIIHEYIADSNIIRMINKEYKKSKEFKNECRFITKQFFLDRPEEFKSENKVRKLYVSITLEYEMSDLVKFTNLTQLEINIHILKLTKIDMQYVKCDLNILSIESIKKKGLQIINIPPTYQLDIVDNIKISFDKLPDSLRILNGVHLSDLIKYCKTKPLPDLEELSVIWDMPDSDWYIKFPDSLLKNLK